MKKPKDKNHNPNLQGKKKHEDHQIKEHEQKRTLENEDWRKLKKNIEIQP